MASIDVGMRSMVPVGQLHPHVENPFFRKKKIFFLQTIWHRIRSMHSFSLEWYRRLSVGVGANGIEVA